MIILIMKVLLHTVIDWMRTEDEGEDGRNINHHGKTITVGGKQDAVAANVEGVRLIDITSKLAYTAFSTRSLDSYKLTCKQSYMRLLR